MAYRIKQSNGSFHITDSLDGEVGEPPIATVSAKHVQLGPFCVTTLTLTNVPQTITNTTAEYAGTKIFDFPVGRISILGVTASMKQKTTSALATTIASGTTGAIALGTATASATSLTGTMVDLLPSTAYTSSTTINVAGAAVGAALDAAAQFDGTTTAKDVFMNTAIATGSADGTQTISGTVTITWVQLGDF